MPQDTPKPSSGFRIFWSHNVGSFQTVLPPARIDACERLGESGPLILMILLCWADSLEYLRFSIHSGQDRRVMLCLRRLHIVQRQCLGTKENQWARSSPLDYRKDGKMALNSSRRVGQEIWPWSAWRLIASVLGSNVPQSCRHSTRRQCLDPR